MTGLEFFTHALSRTLHVRHKHDNGKLMPSLLLLLSFSIVTIITIMAPTGKRSREEPPTVEDVMYYARFLMDRDPFKHRAPKVEDDGFRAMFGCGPAVALILWNKLVSHSLLPPGGRMIHLLWTLMYCKTYAKWKTMRKLTNTDPKTIRRWINLFYTSIFELVPEVVSSLLLLKLHSCESPHSCVFQRLCGKTGRKETS